MYLEFGAMMAGAVIAAALVMKRWARTRQPQSIDFGQVSGGWLAQLKLSKHDPSWP
jgi:hypothetical protein